MSIRYLPLQRRGRTYWLRGLGLVLGLVAALCGLVSVLMSTRPAPAPQQISICGRTWTALPGKQLVISFQAYEGCAGVTVTGGTASGG